MTCTEGCRTLLWEGTGMPEYDSDGSCSCDCDDDRWSDHNALGHPSCVPVKAHLVFGWIGLVLSVAALFHAVYHLRRQVNVEEMVKIHLRHLPRFVGDRLRKQFPTIFWYPPPSEVKDEEVDCVGAVPVPHNSLVRENQDSTPVTRLRDNLPVCWPCLLTARVVSLSRTFPSHMYHN